LHFDVRGKRASVVIKCLSVRRAHVNELVAQRWLPAVGLERACPRVRSTASEPAAERIWQIYEDVGGETLNHFDPDMRCVELVVDLIAELHVRFAEHPLLAECRAQGEELGMSFFMSWVSSSLEHVQQIGSVRSDQHAALRDRLLVRMERLNGEREQRAAVVQQCGGPPTLLHGDLWTSNTLVVDRDGDLRARLIDWDHVGVGPVSYDLSTLLYRFPPAIRPRILARYRERLARAEWTLPSDSDLNSLSETAEFARYACCLAEAASAASRGEAWGFDQMAEIESWFDALEPLLATA
jgi:hypothetical protein